MLEASLRLPTLRAVSLRAIVTIVTVLDIGYGYAIMRLNLRIIIMPKSILLCDSVGAPPTHGCLLTPVRACACAYRAACVRGVWARRSVRVSLAGCVCARYDRRGRAILRALAAMGGHWATLACLSRWQGVAGALRGCNGPSRMAYASAGRGRAVSVCLAYP